jgi:CheY-like chemotaxis protein
VRTAVDLDEALETLQDEQEDCALMLLASLVSEAKTCDIIGVLLKHHQNRDAGPRVAVVADPPTESVLATCSSAEALAVLTKPVEAEALYQLLPDLSVRSLDHQSQPPICVEEAPVQTP